MYLHHRFYKLVFVASGCLVSHPSAQAQFDTASYSGALRSDYLQSTRSLDDASNLVGATVQLKGLLRPTQQTSVKLDARATNAALGRAGYANTQLTESYLAFHQGNWDGRVGKQIIAWGRADGINPTDVISPRDYTVLLPFDEDQRSGVWGAMLSYAWTPELSLSMLWKAQFSESTIPLPGAQLSHYQITTPTAPTKQWGLRLNRVGSDLDWSISYFRGYSLLPQAVSGWVQESKPLQLDYPVVSMFGADLAKNFSAFGARLEVAYTQPENRPNPERPGLRRNLYWVGGFDRTFESRLNLNMQLFWRYTWDLPQSLDPSYWPAQGFNDGILMQQRSQVSGMTLRLSNTWFNETLDAEVFVQRYFQSSDLFIYAKLAYAFSDSVRGTLGGQYFDGDGPQFGRLKKNRGVFAELRYSF